jgi:regulator of protease activity HflC (stomatin/prohibitin superfamily)
MAIVRERESNGVPGVPMLLFLLAAAAVEIWSLVITIRAENPPAIIAIALLLALTGFAAVGFFMVNPNQAQVLQLFGGYRGTAKVHGLRWANPLLTKKMVSLRVRNFESSHLKVNDNEGNPIEIAAVVVWKVVETAEAVFEVDDFENYVHVQTEAALRNLATSYPYDAHDENLISLRGHTSAIADHLKREVQDRLAKAGVEVIEARISHLAYAPEIAAAMLQRQQAGAIIAARQRIVEGAVGMVEMALQMLAHKGIVTLDEERKAAMVSNLLVVLCGERGAQPILNTGTIHQ